MKTDFDFNRDLEAAKRAAQEAKLAKKKAKEALLGIFETNNPCDYCSNDACKICRNYDKFKGLRMRIMRRHIEN